MTFHLTNDYYSPQPGQPGCVDTFVAVTLKAAFYSPGLGRANTVIDETTQVARRSGARQS